jgi:hypothetical protein
LASIVALLAVLAFFVVLAVLVFSGMIGSVS